MKSQSIVNNPLADPLRWCKNCGWLPRRAFFSLPYSLTAGTLAFVLRCRKCEGRQLHGRDPVASTASHEPIPKGDT